MLVFAIQKARASAARLWLLAFWYGEQPMVVMIPAEARFACVAAHVAAKQWCLRLVLRMHVEEQA